jgi:predicted nucleic-acid-binding protein
VLGPEIRVYVDTNGLKTVPATDIQVDANTLLRYLTNEPAQLAERAVQLLEEAERRRFALVVASITLAEVIYVLESVYRRRRDQMVDILLALIDSDIFLFPDRDALIQALIWFRNNSALDFEDAYVGALALLRRGPVMSFDKHLQRVAGLTVIGELGDFDLLFP